jgi:hypothetical protein
LVHEKGPGEPGPRVRYRDVVVRFFTGAVLWVTVTRFKWSVGEGFVEVAIGVGMGSTLPSTS